MQLTRETKPSWLDKPLASLITLNWETILYASLLILAVLTRFWNLEPRVMSHDENSHVYFSWQLSEGLGYKHDPVTHGPFQFHIVALSYLLFGDGDTAARIPVVLFGIATVAFMWNYRRYLGRSGALVAMLLLIISPYMLYYARYVRNESFVAFWGVMLLWGLLRYIETGQSRYALWVTGVNVFHFATKETSYIYAAQMLLFLAMYFFYRLLQRPWPRKEYRNIFITALVSGLALGGVGGGLIWLDKRLVAQKAAELISAATPLPAPAYVIHPFFGYMLLAFAGLALLIAIYLLILGNAPEETEDRAVDRFTIAYLALFLLLGAALAYARFKPDLVLPTPLPQDPGLPATGGADALLNALMVGIQLLPSILIGVGVLFAARYAMMLPAKAFPTGSGERSFDLLMIQGSLLLPLLAAFLINAIGGNPIDYSVPGMVKTAAVLIPVAFLTVGLGWGWNWRIWLPNAILFYGVFTVLYTTLFSNGQGFFTGMVGSLGYWMEQQEVNRGTQPWYYYALVQVPFYEFLPLIGCFLALGLAALRQSALLQTVTGWAQRFQAMEVETGGSATPASQASSRKKPAAGLDTVQGGLLQPPVLSLTGFWAVSALFAYSYAGEKMPWLTVHITLPMILVTAWALGYLIDTTDWGLFREMRAWLASLVMAIFTISLVTFIGLLSSGIALQGQALTQLQTNATLLFSFLATIATAIALVKMLGDWPGKQVRRLFLFTFFGLLAFITARSAFIAAYINYDRPVEFLVYAHSSSDVKEALGQIEEISRRLTGGLDIQIAYDSHTTYPYWWYLRNYPNQKFYGDVPDVSLRDAPVVLVGLENFGEVDKVLKRTHYMFSYQRIWWPIEDYKGTSNKVLSWEEFSYALFNPEMRSAIFQIWWNRDYRPYAALSTQLKGVTIDLSLPKWSPAQGMRLYVRKDLADQLWNYGSIPEVNPYEGKQTIMQPDRTLGGYGVEEGKFNMPRGVAVAPDGSLYVADTANHRIQHLSVDGEVLDVWGEFAVVDVNNANAAPIGTFNEPWGLAVAADGSVFVADTWNYRIQKFDQDGKPLAMWSDWTGGPPDKPNTFYGPRSIAIDANGRVYVADTGNKRIVVFDSDGKYIDEIGVGGYNPGEFNEPIGITFASDGKLYVADTWNQRVQAFLSDSGGVFFPLTSWDVLAWEGETLDNKPYIAVNAAGNVFVSDPEGYRILEFTPDGQIVRYWGDDDGEGRLNLPTGLAVDAGGFLWVADTGSSRILRFSLP